MYRRLESATKLFQAAFNRIAQAIRSIIFNLHGNSHVNCVTHSMHPHAVCTILLNTMHTSFSSSSYYAKFNSIYPSQNGINSKTSKYLTFPCRCNFISMQWYSIVIESDCMRNRFAPETNLRPNALLNFAFYFSPFAIFFCCFSNRKKLTDKLPIIIKGMLCTIYMYAFWRP